MVTQCENKWCTHIHKFKCLNSCWKTCRVKRLVSSRWSCGSNFGLGVRSLSWVWVSSQVSPKEYACQCRRLKTWVQSLGREDPLEEGMAVFLPGKSHGQKSLVGYGPQDWKESDTIEATWHGRVLHDPGEKTMNPTMRLWRGTWGSGQG